MQFEKVLFKSSVNKLISSQHINTTDRLSLLHNLRESLQVVIRYTIWEIIITFRFPGVVRITSDTINRIFLNSRKYLHPDLSVEISIQNLIFVIDMSDSYYEKKNSTYAWFVYLTILK